MELSQVRTRAKIQLGLTHTNSEDWFIDLMIDEAISMMNDIIRLRPAHCCVTVTNGICDVPEDFNVLICAIIDNTQYRYVSRNFFTSFDLECTDGSVVDTDGVVKKISGKLDFGHDVNGEAHLYYTKYNKENGKFIIPEDCYLACMFYACYMYCLQHNDPKWQHYNQLWISHRGKSNSRAQKEESKQAYAETRAVLNDMFYASRCFRVNNRDAISY